MSSSEAAIAEYREAFALFSREDPRRVRACDIGTLLRSLGSNPSEDQVREIRCRLIDVDENEPMVDLDRFIAFMLSGDARRLGAVSSSTNSDMDDFVVAFVRALHARADGRETVCLADVLFALEAAGEDGIDEGDLISDVFPSRTSLVGWLDVCRVLEIDASVVDDVLSRQGSGARWSSTFDDRADAIARHFSSPEARRAAQASPANRHARGAGDDDDDGESVTSCLFCIETLGRHDSRAWLPCGHSEMHAACFRSFVAAALKRGASVACCLCRSRVDISGVVAAPSAAVAAIPPTPPVAPPAPEPTVLVSAAPPSAPAIVQPAATVSEPVQPAEAPPATSDQQLQPQPEPPRSTLSLQQVRAQLQEAELAQLRIDLERRQRLADQIARSSSGSNNSNAVMAQ